MRIRLFLLAATFYACVPEKKPEHTEEIKSKPAVPSRIAPDFKADSAYWFIEKQLSFGPRNPNSKGHKACGQWLLAELGKYADNVIEQKAILKAFDGTSLSSVNIIAEFNPRAAKRVLLCAHWDTRPFADQDQVRRNEPIPGANDGGSGVGILLEIARQLSMHQPSIGVDIILFDAEDYGQPDDSPLPKQEDSWCLGSQYWGKNKHRKDYTAMYGILLDMAGGKDARFVWENTSVNFAEKILSKVWSVGNELGYGAHFNYFRKSGLIDDHLYVNQLTGIPTIDIIEHNIASPSETFHPSWHTHRDDISVIDKNTLKAVGQTVLEVIFREPD
jgi:glutaminyl-peptide cyclotransferase